MRIILVLALMGAAMAKSKQAEVKQYERTGIQMFQLLNTDNADYEQKFSDGQSGTDTVSCYGNECSQNPKGSFIVKLDDGRVATTIRHIDDSVLLGDPLFVERQMSGKIKSGAQSRTGRLNYMFAGRFKYRLVTLTSCQCEAIAMPVPVLGKHGEVKKYTETFYLLSFWPSSMAQDAPDWPEMQ